MQGHAVVLVDPGLIDEIVPFGAADRRREPDLLVGRLFVDHVRTVLVEFNGEHTVGEGHIGRELMPIEESFERVR